MPTRAWPEKLGRRLDRISPITAFLVWIVAGALLIVFSFACNLNSVTGPGGLKLGYLYEINWIANFGFLVPCAMACVFLTLSSARGAVAGLVSADMVVDADGRPVGIEAVEQAWYSVFGKFLRWATWASIAGMSISYVEWAAVSVIPILSKSLGSTDRSGWFVASLIKGVPLWQNLGFGFVAYTLQGLGTSLFLLYVFTVAAFASWIYRFTTQAEPLELFPNTTSVDRRRGFQVLELFVTNMLYCGLGFFLVFFVNRIHFLFLNQTSPPQYTSVYDFFTSEVLAAMGKDVIAIFSSQGTRFFETGGGDAYSVVMSTIGLFCVVGISVLVPVTVLLQAAQRARVRKLVFLQNSGAKPPGENQQPLEEQIACLNTMQVWPVNYPKPILLIALAIVAATSYIFYRLTFVLLAVCLVASFRAILRLVRSLDPESSNEASGRDALESKRAPRAPLLGVPARPGSEGDRHPPPR